MIDSSESRELRNLVKGETGREFLLSFRLIEAHVKSETILNILRQCASTTVARAEELLDCKICLIAFGSLGRFEFVPSHSDLDPLLVIFPNGDENPDPAEVRSLVISPLAKMCPWLLLDDRELVESDQWNEVPNVELKYPVIQRGTLVSDDDLRIRQRRWQIILEARPLYNDSLFSAIKAEVVPWKRRTASLGGGEPAPADINFSRLIREAPEIFAGFEDPSFLFKSAHKYWKTRFLREFYAFSTNLSFVLGWYIQNSEGPLEASYLGGSTATKIIRSTRFAREFERECDGNPELQDHYSRIVDEVIKRWGLSEAPLLLFGRDYSSRPARLLHGLLVSVFTRFGNCWSKLYDDHVLTSLERVPKEATNFDAQFRARIPDSDARETVDELLSLRRSYLRYMGATAELVDRAFPRGRVWSHFSVSRELSEALRPYYRPDLLRSVVEASG